jgi:tryptophan synthase beta chain
MKTKKYLLNENDIPQAWYNVIADMKNKPQPLINPGTKTTAQGGRPLSAVF